MRARHQSHHIYTREEPAQRRLACLSFCVFYFYSLAAKLIPKPCRPKIALSADMSDSITGVVGRCDCIGPDIAT